ncbi:DNA polymerase III subunit gamma/tau C-terminal domain-containing protein [Taylorella equigenitalis]|uniref:DNA polymerase III subunit gamma/tau C-terminal domain-containing protein n=1 Tax=Taylorella equigenitalis TaxID=29575 RepID=UPI00237DB763|nr:DNA polymerase III subunit gamma/tau C-terminal domain-containing protein [Taylorella equigenitalis]WDU52645.1 hypothetical protein KNO32_06055 [Taylorella equigenitalis]
MEVVQTFKETGLVQQIAINSQYVKTEDDTIFLKSELLQSNQENTKKKFSKFLSDYFGRTVAVEFELGEVSFTLKQKRDEEHNAKMAVVMDKIEKNDFIKKLKEHCQAVLIPDSVKITHKNSED